MPAPGVEIEGVDGARMEWGCRPLCRPRVPLGALYAGQHREALVRVRLSGSSAGTQRALASVRLTLPGSEENDVERVQEVLARRHDERRPAAVAEHASAQTHAMIATLEAAKTELQAAQDVGAGNFAQAQTQLAAAEQNLRDEAARDQGRRREARSSTTPRRPWPRRAVMRPPQPRLRRLAAARADVLEMNKAAMGADGVLIGERCYLPRLVRANVLCATATSSGRKSATSAPPEPRLLEQLRDERRPPGLRARAEALAGVAVEVLVERDVVAEVRVVWSSSLGPWAGAPPVGPAREERDEAARQLRGDLPERHHAARAGRGTPP